MIWIRIILVDGVKICGGVVDWLIFLYLGGTKAPTLLHSGLHTCKVLYAFPVLLDF